MATNFNGLLFVKNAITFTQLFTRRRRFIAPLLTVVFVHPLHGGVQLLVIKTQLGNALVTELITLAQWAFDGNAAVTKFMVVENFTGKGFGGFGFRVS